VSIDTPRSRTQQQRGSTDVVESPTGTILGRVCKMKDKCNNENCAANSYNPKHLYCGWCVLRRHWDV